MTGLDVTRLREMAAEQQARWPGMHPANLRAPGTLADLAALLDRLEAAEAAVERVRALADGMDAEARTLGRSLSELMLRDVARQVRAALDGEKS